MQAVYFPQLAQHMQCFLPQGQVHPPILLNNGPPPPGMWQQRSGLARRLTRNHSCPWVPRSSRQRGSGSASGGREPHPPAKEATLSNFVPIHYSFGQFSGFRDSINWTPLFYYISPPNAHSRSFHLSNVKQSLTFSTDLFEHIAGNAVG